MKKLLCMLLALTMALSLAACGGNNEPAVDPEAENEIEVEDITENKEPESDTVTDEPAEEVKDEGESAEDKTEEEKKDEPAKTEPQKNPSAPAQKPAEKPATPPTSSNTQSTTPSAPPAQKPAEKPAEPQTPPANNPTTPEAPSTSGTVGDTLAAVWRANSGKSTEEIANAVISHSSIQFMSAVMPVEEGFLTGFDNAEIKGFSSAHMFGPTIGTIAFVGYVFELSDGTDADAFVKTLKSSANPRWNICTEAEQTIVEKSGNKVFFLMCPKNFEE